MDTKLSFDYAVLRIVPRVEREEFVNAGVVLFCLQRRYLRCLVHLDAARLCALWPAADPVLAARHLHAVERICEGAVDGGPIARLSLRERFHWITAPRSTILQSSPVRTGICTDGTDLDERLRRLAADLLNLPPGA